MAFQTQTAILGLQKAEAHASRLVVFLENLRTLEPNWDGDDAQAPDGEAISDAIELVSFLSKKYPGIGFEQACPGASGEVVVELREENRSVEFIFYPAKKWKFVAVGGSLLPEQGKFNYEMLPHLMKRLKNA